MVDDVLIGDFWQYVFSDAIINNDDNVLSESLVDIGVNSYRQLGSSPPPNNFGARLSMERAPQ